ncbi:arsenite-activated ATPase ArsA [Alkaliphilus metalliredigens QYMF]|uniref:arsenite-transporting ATPase n=1 Tax=Alkaliphilus metalliredigens (strain QYMF) TaxID=293826 RepID=A6TNA8_ALKMQ|nr:ArsA family ATPase [Alkaliphilus metalliredigens]ABR47676.1 arsenite-activated ATPase ArsA [Alkaliphilus metalliredigens QYMF]
MRIILYTGKGGVGKTSIAAATALKCAKRGYKTLVVSTDASHSLGDSLDVQLSPEAVEIEKNLWAQEIDTMHETEQGWKKVQEYLTSLMTSKTVKDITTEELTIFPGIEDLLSLLKILSYYKEKKYDVIVIDCAPTGETLAMLSFPDMFRWWMDKLFPMKRKAIKMTKPILEPILGMPMPSDGVMGEILNIYNQLDEMRQVLSNREVTSIRIVVNPEKMVVKEAQRSFTYMNLYDFNVDAIVVNRMIPNRVTDDYFKAWKEIHKKYKTVIIESFSPVPIYYVPLLENEIVGTKMLSRMGELLFEDDDPSKIFYNTKTQEIIKEERGYHLSIYMPFVQKGEVSLSQKGDELIVKVGTYKRNMILPRTLLNYSIRGAKFENHTLKIKFGGEDID